jgi:hypothetical protein
MSSGLPCQREVGFAATAPYALTVPLQLTHIGESFRGTVAIDRLLPGRCGWEFSHISYARENAVVPPDPIAQYDGRPDHMADSRADVWCIIMSSKGAEGCSSLVELALDFPNLISPGWKSVIPQAERGVIPITFGRSARSITVQFHDIDSMPNLHVPRH